VAYFELSFCFLFIFLKKLNSEIFIGNSDANLWLKASQIEGLGLKHFLPHLEAKTEVKPCKDKVRVSFRVIHPK